MPLAGAREGFVSMIPVGEIHYAHALLRIPGRLSAALAAAYQQLIA